MPHLSVCLPRLLLPAAFMFLAACAGVPRTAPVGASTPGMPTRLAAPPADAAEDVIAGLLHAELALVDGDAPEAARRYAELAATTADPRVAARAARLALEAGNADAADALITRMVATGAAAAAVARARARLALLRGDRARARAALAEVIAPGTMAAWAAAGRILDGARDPALAGVLLEALATPDALPADADSVWIGMSQLAERLNRYAFATELALAAVDRFASVPAYGWAAHLLRDSGRETEAMALYARGVHAHPDSAELRRAWAAALDEDGDDAGALAVLAAGPQTLEVLAAQAAHAARLDDEAALRRIYATLAAQGAHYERDVDFLLGQLAETLGDTDAALEHYLAVPPTDRHAFEAVVRRAVLLSGRGESGAAHRLAQQLRRDWVDDTARWRRAWLLDAQLYLREGAPEAAEAVYDRALEALPDDVELLYGRALTAADRGGVDRALADLRRVLELDPDNLDAANALGYTLADADRDLDEAEELLRRALAGKPDEPAIMDSWGWLKYRQGDLESAETWLRKAWELARDAEIGAHLGEVLWQRGERAEAAAILDAVQELDPDNATLRRTRERLQP